VSNLKSLAESIEKRMALRILRGEIAPGARLPPVRQLAAEMETTTPTIQRVIDRLSTAGLVSSRRGSGVVVRDPTRNFDPWLLPLWLEALQDQPARAAALLGDFLELRRVVAAHLVRTRRDKLVRAVPTLADLARQLGEATTTDEVIDIDQAITRTVVEAAEQGAVTAVFGITERVIRDVRPVAEALYGDLPAYRERVASVAHCVALADPDRAANEMVATLEGWDRRTCERFEASLSRT